MKLATFATLAHNGIVSPCAAAALTAESSSPSARPREENVIYVRAAGFPRRLLAAVVDTLLLAAVAIGASGVAALILDIPLPAFRELGPDFVLAGILDRNPLALGAAGLFVGVGALYQIYLGGIIGQTMGKRMFGLRVISNRGGAPGPARGIVRFLALTLSVLPAALGFLWCLFDRERRSFHDHLSGTHVIIDV